MSSTWGEPNCSKHQRHKTDCPDCAELAREADQRHEASKATGWAIDAMADLKADWDDL